MIIKNLINQRSPIINGDDFYSYDFTCIDKVILMNLLCLTTDNQEALNQVYKTAAGKRNSKLELLSLLKKYLSEFDHQTKEIERMFGHNRKGNLPHSLECIDKANRYLGYYPSYKTVEQIKRTVQSAIEKV